jgi:hypothetical protein
MQRSTLARQIGLGALAVALALLVGVASAPRHAGAQPVVGQQLSVTVEANGDVIVTWRETPGNAGDWVSIVHAGAADDTYESTWTYTNGQRAGSYHAGRLAPGDYEARLYLDWPRGGYRVVDRVPFRVEPDASGGLFESRYLEVALGANGDVIVTWQDTPGNGSDWVSVVHAGAPDTTYESTWAYTDGQRSGSYNAGRLAPGEYEARLYLDWPRGGYQVVDRVRFRVR